MKPDAVNAILDEREVQGMRYLNLREAGTPMEARVLNWLFQHILETGKNAVWQVNGGLNWAGSPDFVEAIKAIN